MDTATQNESDPWLKSRQCASPAWRGGCGGARMRGGATGGRADGRMEDVLAVHTQSVYVPSSDTGGLNWRCTRVFATGLR